MNLRPLGYEFNTWFSMDIVIAKNQSHTVSMYLIISAVSGSSVSNLLAFFGRAGGNAAASGICNAASRVAGLLAVAVFGALFSGIFKSALERRLDRLDLMPAARAQIEAQRSRLAAAETRDARGWRSPVP